jgi:nucleotide-binding universal stress UspA family protein
MAFTHILVPTDFSDPAHQAVRYAAEEAALHGASVTLLHVLGSSEGTDVYYVTGSPDRSAQGRFDPIAGGRLGAPPSAQPTVVRRDPGEDALTQLNDLIPEGQRATWRAETATGSPADTIVRLAQEKNVDLIVMGTRGRSGLQQVLIGSVAEKVVRLAPCPVMTVRHNMLA